MPDEGDRVHEETTDPHDEPPDIDVDFEHERREEVIQWSYETYGRTRSALTAVVSRYRARGAIPA